ncbi:serine protease FAM111A-like [Epinephelus lanceolatus]
MPPKKQKIGKDIRSFFRTTDSPARGNLAPSGGSQPGGAQDSQSGGPTHSQQGGAKDSQSGGPTHSQPAGATGPQMVTRSKVKVKEENDGDPMGEHLHRLTVKLSPAVHKEYTVDCDRPRTVLEAIKTIEDIKCPDENIVIQLGKADKKYTVATHFPCTCVEDGESLIISRDSEKVEKAEEKMFIYAREKYSVFYIETVGGLYTRQKKLFRNKALKQFKYLVVYGEKGMTVEEALIRDGRFIDDLGVFELSDSKTSQITKCTQKVDNLDGKEFKVCLPRQKKANKKQLENSGASNNSPQKCDTKRVRGLVHQRGISVQTAVAKADSNNTAEIYKKLRQQFPALKEWMEKRFPENSYQTALNLKKENFGKIQHSFSEVHRVRKLLKLGDSVCKVAVQDGLQGTGFVLFDNFILTNAHLFKGCVEGQKLMEGTEVSVFFNYEDPMPYTNYSYFQLAHSYICYSEGELDYAVLELKPEGQEFNQTTQTKQIKVPPGLLRIFGPMPPNGEACLIGHPAGGVKRMDPTCIIEKEKREQAVRDHLHPYKDSLFIVHSISHLIKEQGIENIMMGGRRAENVATYNTFMYHGSSGSPVFDAHGRVFGLHTAGYTYGFPNHKESVIEFAQPVLTIFEHFVSKLKESGNEKLLKRVQEEAKGNPHLSSMGTCTDVPADSDEPMETE